MLAKYFIEFIVFIVGQVLSIFSSAIPGNNDLSILTTAITSLLGVTTQITNFMYFIFGDSLYAITVLLGWFLPFKFVAVPVLSFIRKLVVLGGGQG